MKRWQRIFVLFCWAVSVPEIGLSFDKWPDTGQTKCFNNNVEIPCPAPGNDFYGQDAQYEGQQRSYTKLAYGDEALPDTATQTDGWIMTRDNVTGLIWEIKTDDGTIHDNDNRYSWCDTNPATNGGYTGGCTTASVYGTELFINAVNSVNFGGHADWRLPTITELSTLVNPNNYPGPTIDSEFFPATQSSCYWSSNTWKSNWGYAWKVDFANGVVFVSDKRDNYCLVYAVRSGP